MSRGPLINSSGNVLGLVCLAVGGIRNYAVSANIYQYFVDGQHRRKTGVKEGVPVMLLVGYRVVLFNDPMNNRKQVDYMLRDVGVGGRRIRRRQ